MTAQTGAGILRCNLVILPFFKRKILDILEERPLFLVTYIVAQVYAVFTGAEAMAMITTEMKEYIKHRINWVQRRLYLGDLETIADVKRREPDFAATVEKIRDAGTESIAYFKNGYRKEGGLRLQQNPEEYASLVLSLRAKGPYENYLEVGSASGGSCHFLSREVGFKNIFSVDDGKHPAAKEQKGNFGHLTSFKQFIGDSHSPEAAAFLKGAVKAALDIAFIDGDHSYQGVWQDLQLVLPHCRPGTLIIFHDTVACTGVEKAWLRSIKEKLVAPLAEYIGDEVPLGIGLGRVV